MVYSIVVVVVIVLATFFMRVLPFLIFNSKREAPNFLLYLGKVLPSAIVGMLIVYCLKEIEIFHIPYGLNEVLACLCVVVLEWLFKKSILSILVGTFLYMYLVQSDILETLFAHSV